MSQPFIDLSGGNVNIGSNGPTQDIKLTDSDGKTSILKKGEQIGGNKKKEGI